MNCSDAHLAHVCGQCGGLLSVCLQPILREVGEMALGLGGSSELANLAGAGGARNESAVSAVVLGMRDE